MISFAVLIVIIVVALALVVAFFYLPAWQQRRIKNRPVPPAWRALLEKNLPIYSALQAHEQKRLHQLIHLFMATKQFVGCGGLQINDEIKITITAQACLLMLNQKAALYPKLYSVLVYPYGFSTERQQTDENGVTSTVNHQMLGESWSNGKVILSWDDVLAGAHDFSDGHNVVLHEFAHQLDAESGSTNGAPPLHSNCYKSWATVLSGEFQQLQSAHNHQQPSIIDQYGASNPAEFFAVATETFFEKPQQLFKNHRALFDELKQYYQVDPNKWH